MSLLDTKFKQPAERLDYDIYYEDWLTAGDGITTAKTTVQVFPLGLTLSSYVVDTIIKIWVAGGVNGVTYKVTVTVETDDGRVKQDEFKIKVKDI